MGQTPKEDNRHLVLSGSTIDNSHSVSHIHAVFLALHVAHKCAVFSPHIYVLFFVASHMSCFFLCLICVEFFGLTYMSVFFASHVLFSLA